MKLYHKYYKLFQWPGMLNQCDSLINGGSFGIENIKGRTGRKSESIRRMSGADCDLEGKNYITKPQLFKVKDK